MYDDAGNPVDVPDEQAGEAFLSGKLGFAPGARVAIIDPDGAAPGTVPAENLHEALANGWRIEGDAERAARKEREKYNTLGQEALTALEGVGSGATLGLSRVVQDIALEDAEAQAARARTNPIASGVGEVAGAVLPVALSGGGAAPAAATRAGAVARAIPTVAAARTGGAIARAAEASGAAPGLARAVGAAGEGALQGLGMAITEDVLDQQPSTPDKFLASAGLGALFGGGTSGVLSAVSSVAARAAGHVNPAAPAAVSGRAIDAVADAVEREAAQDATTFGGKLTDALIGKDRRVAAQQLMKRRDLRGALQRSPDEIGTLTEDATKGLEELISDVDAGIRTTVKTTKRADIVAGAARMDPVPVRERGFQLVSEMRAQVDHMRANPADFADAPEIKDLARQVKKLEKALGVKRVADRATGVSTYGLDPKKSPSVLEVFDAFDQVRHNLDNIADLGASARAVQGPAANVAGTLRKGIREFLESEPLFGSAGVAQQRGNAIMTEWIAAKKAFLPFFGKDVSGTWRLDPGKMEAFMKSMGTPGATLEKEAFLNLMRSADKIASDALNDPAVTARMTSTFLKTASLADTHKAQALLRRVLQRTGGVEQAATSAIGRVVLGGALGGAPGAVAGYLAPAVGSTVLSLLNRAIQHRGAAIRSLSKTIAKGRVLRERAPATATKIFLEYRFSDRSYSRNPRDKQEAYARAAAEIRELKDDAARRKALAMSKLQPLAAEAPRLAQAALMGSERAFAVVAAAFPEKKPGPIANEPIPPTDLEIEDAATVLRAVSDPVTVLEDLASGRLNVKARDAVREAYPDLYMEMAREVAAALDEESGSEIGYEQRIQLAMFFGIEGMEPTLDPLVIRRLQEVYLQQPEQAPVKLRSTKDIRSIRMAASATDLIEGRQYRRPSEPAT